MIVLDVAGMKEDACCRRIQESISARDPDATIAINRPAGRMSVDTVLSPDDVIEATKTAGYSAALAFPA